MVEFKQLWSTGRVAEEHGCSDQAVRNAIELGELNAYEIVTAKGGQARYAVPIRAALAWKPRPPGRQWGWRKGKGLKARRRR